MKIEQINLLTIGELDKELWNEEKRLWSNSLIEDISDVYDKRVAEIPHKYSFRDGNTDSRSGNPSLGDGSTQSRVKEKKVNKSRVVSESAHTTVDLKAFAEKYKIVVIPQSYERFKLNQQKQGKKYIDVAAEKAAFEIWVLNDIKYGKNLRAVKKDEAVTRHCPNMHGSVNVLTKELHKGVFCKKCKEQMIHESELVKTNSIPF